MYRSVALVRGPRSVLSSSKAVDVIVFLVTLLLFPRLNISLDDDVWHWIVPAIPALPRERRCPPQDVSLDSLAVKPHWSSPQAPPW